MQPLKGELPKGSDAVLHTPKLQGSEELSFPLELQTRVEAVPLWLVMLKATSWQRSAMVSVRGVIGPHHITGSSWLMPEPWKDAFLHSIGSWFLMDCHLWSR